MLTKKRILAINRHTHSKEKLPNFEKDFHHTKQIHKSSLISLFQCSKNCSFVLSSFSLGNVNRSVKEANIVIFALEVV
jgi:hypothetical protein